MTVTFEQAKALVDAWVITCDMAEEEDRTICAMQLGWSEKAMSYADELWSDLRELEKRMGDELVAVARQRHIYQTRYATAEEPEKITAYRALLAQWNEDEPKLIKVLISTGSIPGPPFDAPEPLPQDGEIGDLDLPF